MFVRLIATFQLEFNRLERIDWKCGSGKAECEKATATKKIVTPPEVLLVQLKRFEVVSFSESLVRTT